MSKCNKCKYEYSSKLDEPCKYCREKCGVITLDYQMSEDKFVPKEEQSTIEHDGCMGCVYEDFEEFDEIDERLEHLRSRMRKGIESACQDENKKFALSVMLDDLVLRQYH